jgi:hypothetical protein
MEGSSLDMLIVIPVGPSDAQNLHLLTQAINRLGVVEAPILIVSVPSLQAEAESAAALLNATVALTEDEFANGWPVGPDRMFIWTIRHLAEIGNDQPWLWLEPDACPIKAGWDVMLRNEYHAAGKPYFGYTRPTAWRDAEGNLTPIEGDNMLLGVAIYPPNMHKDKELAPLLNDLSLPDPVSHPPVPWDIYLRWAFFRKGVHGAHVIYDRWRTCNYVRGEFDEIICEPLPTEKNAVGGTIPDEAVIVHGCKDGSLHRLVIGEKAVWPKVIQGPEGTGKTFLKKVVESQTDGVLVNEEALKEDFKDWVTPAETAQPINTLIEKQPLPDKPKSALLTKEQRVLEALNTMDQPRVGAIVDLTKLDKKTVKEILPTLGYEVLHAGWIRKLPEK